MALISKTTIQEVNDRMDAVSVVGEYLRLDKKSGRWWGKCPFHGGGNERTASFKVDPDLKTYHCFGCNKGGSIISFIMEMDSLTYPEAIKHLAQKIGIEIIYEKGHDFEIQDNTLKEQLYELYKRTNVSFMHFLNNKEEGKPAKKYLFDRGISSEMIELFKLGYAPPDRDFLYKFLMSKGYSEEFLGQSGLFSKNYKTIPLFSGRIIFPITDRQGRIVAFGGRALTNDDNTPKYINSPETPIYKKGQTLFAIDLAKTEMRKTKTAVLAEGYMDVIAFHQAGVFNAVAPLGTAFTDDQAIWLARWVEKIILVFDDDDAGIKAAFKAVITCRKHGLACKILNLRHALNGITGGAVGGAVGGSGCDAVGGEITQKLKDPADILQKKGQNILKNLLEFTIFDIEYLIKLASHPAGDGSKNSLKEYLFPFLSVLDSEIERDDYITRIADYFRIEKTAVQKDFAGWKKNIRQEGYIEPVMPQRKPLKRNYELIMVAVSSVNMELYPKLRQEVRIQEIDDFFAKELFIALEECFTQGEQGIDFLLSRIKDESLKNFIVSNAREFTEKNSPKLLEDGIKEVKKKRILKRLGEIQAEIRLLEREQDADSAQEKIDELLLEKKQLDEQIKKLKELKG